MELGISSYSYFGAKSASFSMDDAIKHAKSTGFDGMEFSYGERHGDLSCIDSMKYFSDKCAESGLKTYCCNGGINLMAQDMKEQIENGKALVDAAKAFGAPMARCDTIGGDFGESGFGGIRAAIKRIAEGIGVVADYANENGIKLLVENHGRIMQDSIIVEELINTVNRPYYGALVDIGNFMCADEDSAKGVGRMSRYAMHVHVKDFHFKSGNEIFLPSAGWFKTRGGNYLRGAMLGHGQVPVYQCIKTLADNGYNGALSLEFEGVESTLFAIEESYKVLSKALELAGVQK